ncbi:MULTISPECIES: xanthine dehydrogenase family protein subunit M [unclassified Roseovarius]|uniref:FAD binding domain-containing protein n=1 Tax=unclassified Roseovarius TaxID=2614913 RepID=UPI00273D04A5|nr:MULTISPECIES: FAD binding domain-containing protein [unclassified Roseovarius]
MYPAPIEEIHSPGTIEEALTLLARAEEREVMAIAGGMSLMQAIKSRVVRPDVVVDLNRVDALSGVVGADEAIEIGAMTRYAELARNPLLRDGAFAAVSDAASRVGDRQVRNRGTIGGSLCWNYVAACIPTATLALGGEIELRWFGSSGVETRLLSIDDFLIGPLETARELHELLSCVRLRAPRPETGSAYKKWGLATASLPVIGIGVRITLDDSGRCANTRVAATGLTNGTKRLTVAEEAINGIEAADGVALCAAFAAAARDVEVQGDRWANENYRRMLVERIGAEVARTAIERAGRKK